MKRQSLSSKHQSTTIFNSTQKIKFFQVIDALPDDPYGQLPEGANPDQHKPNKQAQEQE